MQDNDIASKTKMQTLMDLVSKMKEMQGQSASSKPGHGVALEVHETHVEPLSHGDVEDLEEKTHQDLDNDGEEGESPEHKALVLGSDKSHMDQEDANHDDLNSESEPSDEEEQDDHLSPLALHPGLMQLLQEHLMSKK